MHLIDGPVLSEGSWPSKNSLHSVQSQGSNSQQQQLDPVYQLGANLLTFNEIQVGFIQKNSDFFHSET